MEMNWGRGETRWRLLRGLARAASAVLPNHLIAQIMPMTYNVATTLPSAVHGQLVLFAVLGSLAGEMLCNELNAKN